MALPPVVTGWLLLIICGIEGPVGAWLWQRFQIRLAFTPQGAALACAVMVLPFMVRAMRQGIEAVDPRPATGGAHAGRRAARPVLFHHLAAGGARRSDGGGHGLHRQPGRVRRCDHLRRPTFPAPRKPCRWRSTPPCNRPAAKPRRRAWRSVRSCWLCSACWLSERIGARLAPAAESLPLSCGQSRYHESAAIILTLAVAFEARRPA